MVFPDWPDLMQWFRDAETVIALYKRAAAAPADRLTGWSLRDRDPRVIAQLLPFFDWIYQYYFRVKTDGWEHIPASGQVLLIGSHNGGLAAPDTVMMAYDWFRRFGPERPVYALMEPRIWQAFPGLARLATQVGTIQPHPQMAIAALRHNASVLIYPGGVEDVFRPYAQRHQICLNGRQAFIKLALREQVPIVPLISYGAHSTLIVLANLYPWFEKLRDYGFQWPLGIDPGTFPIYLGLPWGVALGPLPNIPLPVQLHTRVCRPIVFDRYGAEAERDRDYVTACYERVRSQMQAELDRLVQEEEAG